MTLNCVTFNCRGLNNSRSTLLDLLSFNDVILIQEHWLFQEKLHVLSNFHNDFAAVGVSGMDSCVLLHGRPYGGCAILVRKSLLPFVSMINCVSDRFVALKIRDSQGLSYLFISIYMPSFPLHPYSAYLDTLGELEGFLDSVNYDYVIIAGDFNVDFCRASPVNSLLLDFITSNDLCCVDRAFQDNILFTYESDDGSRRSWIDHVMVSSSISSSIDSVSRYDAGCTLSDHYPLQFHFRCDLSPSVNFSSTSRCSGSHFVCDWHKATSDDIQKYIDCVGSLLPVVPTSVLDCCNPHCQHHRAELDLLFDRFVDCLSLAASLNIPHHSPSTRRKLLSGWTDGTHILKQKSVFWHRVWVEAGCPSSGVLFQIKKHAKHRFKYSVRRLKRREHVLNRHLLARSFSAHSQREFWSSVRRLNGKSSTTSSTSVIDGTSGDTNVANLFSKNIQALLASNDTADRSFLSSAVHSSLSVHDLDDISVSVDTVFAALSKLKPSKKETTTLSSDHFIKSSSVIAPFLASFVTALLRHCYMPSVISGCTLVPIPKPGKDPSCSDNYRAIALASTTSKIIEWIILLQYSQYFSTSDLQFGFKPGISTSMCTGSIKNIVSHYLSRDSRVFGCFLDASKAFDLVNHTLLFQLLLDRCLPKPIVLFLLNWYSSQQVSVRWSSSLSAPFTVSNGVRQGGVLSPILFAIYIDVLICRLSMLGIGCHWRNLFVGCLCYADDVVLLAPSIDALRRMLHVCSAFADDYGLRFNPTKTQLICFTRSHSHPPPHTPLKFGGVPLFYKDAVSHLGHILSHDLSDSADIIRATRDMVRKANCLLTTFSCADSLVTTHLFRSFCLSLYGASLWRSSSKALKSLEVSFNKILRRIWHLPPDSHTSIVHCTSYLSSVFNLVYSRCSALIDRACNSASHVVRSIFSEARGNCTSFCGFNYMYGNRFTRVYSRTDLSYGDLIRFLHLFHKSFSFSCNVRDLISLLSTY